MMPRRPGNQETVEQTVESKPNLPKLDHIPAMRIPEKATGAQVTGATNFNNMRQRLLDIGEMEER